MWRENFLLGSSLVCAMFLSFLFEFFVMNEFIWFRSFLWLLILISGVFGILFTTIKLIDFKNKIVLTKK